MNPIKNQAKLIAIQEELADLKGKRDSMNKLGWAMFIVGIILAVLVGVAGLLDALASGARSMPNWPIWIILFVFIAFAVGCFIISGVVFDKKYREKIEELKKYEGE